MPNARTLTHAAAAFAVALLAARGADAATAISGSVALNPVAFVDNSASGDVSRAAAWTGAPTDLSVTTQIRSSAAAEVTARGRTDAHWDLATQTGFVRLSDRGWLVDDSRALSTQVGVSLVSSLAAPDWNYSFVADGDGIFLIQFDLSASGAATGLGSWDLAVSVDGGPAVVRNLLRVGAAPAGVHSSGGHEEALQAGRTYSISLLNNEGFNESPVIQRTRNATERGTFNWSITEAAVPEPSTWLLMLTGFGALGSALRRARRTALVHAA
jgi:hypothetical protein